MKKRFKLDEIKIASFVTKLDQNSIELKGGCPEETAFIPHSDICATAQRAGGPCMQIR